MLICRRGREEGREESPEEELPTETMNFLKGKNDEKQKEEKDATPAEGSIAVLEYAEVF